MKKEWVLTALLVVIGVSSHAQQKSINWNKAYTDTRLVEQAIFMSKELPVYTWEHNNIAECVIEFYQRLSFSRFWDRVKRLDNKDYVIDLIKLGVDVDNYRLLLDTLNPYTKGP